MRSGRFGLFSSSEDDSAISTRREVVSSLLLKIVDFEIGGENNEPRYWSFSLVHGDAFEKIVGFKRVRISRWVG